MRFGNLCTTAVALAAAAILTPALAAQTVSKQAAQTNTPALFTLSAQSPGPGTVSLQWTRVSGAVSYRIERAKSFWELPPEASTTRITPTQQLFVIADAHPINSYTDTGLWNDATYVYRVTAVFDSKAATCQTTNYCTRVTSEIAWVKTAP